MAHVITNEKGYQILSIDCMEMFIMLNSPGVCDHCNKMPDNGYLIVVLNHWCCPECTNKWYSSSEPYPEDKPIEERNWTYYMEMVRRTGIQMSKEQDIKTSLNIE